MGTVFTLTPPVLMTGLFLVLGFALPIGFVFMVLIKRGLKNATVSIAALCITVGIFGTIIASSYQTNVEITESSLVVRCPPFAIKLVDRLDVIEVFIVDWNTNASYRPALRTGGTSFGSYKVGWFKLENGAPALLVTSSSKNLCIRTTEGYYLLLGPENFTRFLQAFNATFAS